MEENEKKFLNKIKTNIISWYSFKENATILLVGEEIEEYGEYLKRKGFKVFFDKNLYNQEFYDYVIIFEQVDLIKDIKKILKPDGIILLITNNILGIQNFSILNNFEQLINKNLNQYSKKQIENIIKENGYENFKFYYPLPDYKTANVIFSDDYLPEYNNTKLVNNYYYQKDVKILFKETELLKEITRLGEFTNFTNSYLVEINNKSPEKFIGFNNTRRDEFRICTKIYDEYVIKEEISEESKKHIENMSNNIHILNNCGIESLDFIKDSKIYSKYISGKTLYQLLIDYILENEIEKAKTLIKEYNEFLKERFISEKTEEINLDIFENTENIKELNFVKNGLMDLVLENIFKIDGEYVTFDQEWNVENIPLEFILYRAINNVYIYNQEIEKKISKLELYKEFCLEKYVEEFKIAEKNIQQKIVDLEKIKVYENSQKSTYINVLENDIKRIEEKNNVIKQLENTIKEKSNYEQSLNKNIEDHKNHISRLEDALKEKDDQIKNLNEIIKQKQLTINYYENMRIVKFIKKIKK